MSEPRIDIWQEYDRPSSCDFDLFDEQIVCAGQKFYCSGCGREHVGGVDGPTGTSIDWPGREFPEYRGLPKDEAEKAAWLAEVAAAQAAL